MMKSIWILTIASSAAGGLFFKVSTQILELISVFTLFQTVRASQPDWQFIQNKVPRDQWQVHDICYNSSSCCPARVCHFSGEPVGKLIKQNIVNQYVNIQFRLQNIDLPNTTPERIEALIHLVAEEHDFEEQLKKVGYKPFLACVILFHVKILESDKSDDYSDLEFRWGEEYCHYNRI